MQRMTLSDAPGSRTPPDILCLDLYTEDEDINWDDAAEGIDEGIPPPVF